MAARVKAIAARFRARFWAMAARVKAMIVRVSTMAARFRAMAATAVLYEDNYAVLQFYQTVLCVVLHCSPPGRCGHFHWTDSGRAPDVSRRTATRVRPEKTATGQVYS